MPRGLMEFAGERTLTRAIEDHFGPLGWFEGAATLTRDGVGFIYTEAGLLTLGTAAALQAERCYLWRADGRLIEVLFHDHRPFHRFEAHAGGMRERHCCDPDIYDVVYALDDWPTWRSNWTVTGPRKRYTLRSDYVPKNGE